MVEARDEGERTVATLKQTHKHELGALRQEHTREMDEAKQASAGEIEAGAAFTKQRYNGTLDCFRQIVTKEGPLALWKGFMPCWMRIGPHTLVTFVIMEQIKGLLTGGKKASE